MELRPAVAADYDEVRRLLAETGWAARVADADRFRRMLDGADRKVVAVDGGAVVGFGRALCDGATNGYLSTVVVAPEHRGRGIGSALVERLCGEDPSITWVLRSGRESTGFWEKLGFTRSRIAMERTRTRS